MSLTAEQTSLMLALAQVAVAFAGFAGVVGSFSRFTTHERVTAFRVRGMVALALFGLVMALAPIAADAAAFSAAWRIASVFSAALGSLCLAMLLRGVLPLFRDGLLHTQLLNLIWYGLAIAMIGALVAVAAGLAPASAASRIYAASIVLVLFLCAYNFLMLVMSIRFDANS